MLYRSPFPDAPIPEVSLVDFIFKSAPLHSEKPALIDGSTNRILTYRQLVEQVGRAAAALAVRGVGTGDVVALYGPNSPEYVTVFYAVTSLGAIVTTLNPLYNVAELAHQLRDSGASVLIAAAQTAGMERRAAERLGITRVFELEDVATTAVGAPANGPPCVDHTIDARRQVAALVYSNVTTDVPMGVMLTHYNLIANVVQTSVVDPIDESEVLIGMMPFCQMYGMVAVNIALQAGATIVTIPQFSLPCLLEVMHRYKVTTAYLVPAIIRTLAKHPAVDRYDLSALRHIVSLTAPLPEAVGRACAERIGCTMRQAYGLTEAVAFSHFTPRGHARISSVGPAVPNTEFRIVDVAAQKNVPPGRLGEILIRGPQVMNGYRNFPEVTDQVIDNDGWFHTCDLGYADRDGYLFVVDRSKRLVRLRGLHRQDAELLRAAVEDIAGRREAAERLAFQGVLLDSVHESVVSTDLKNIVTFWNKGAEKLFGYTAAEALGKPVDSLIVPPGHDLVQPDKTVALRRHGTWNAPVVRRRKDGSELWADLTVSIIRNADGERSGFLGIHRDITEQKRVEQLLKDSHERLRNLAARLMVVREQERSLIARELHDELGQALTRLNIDLCWLIERLPRRLKTKRAQAMATLVDRMVKTVQHISSELRPAILDDLGLEAAIEWHAHEFADWSGCRCQLDLRIATLARNHDRDIAVFRILQEALTNVARHARAQTVAIRAWTASGVFVLEIKDDGVGIPQSRLSSPHSLGLSGMRERAEGLGGQISFSSAGKRGSLVTLRVPVLQPAALDGAAP
jgi:PAS domain S-box-containing protein